MFQTNDFEGEFGTGSFSPGGKKEVQCRSFLDKYIKYFPELDLLWTKACSSSSSGRSRRGRTARSTGNLAQGAERGAMEETEGGATQATGPGKKHGGKKGKDKSKASAKKSRGGRSGGGGGRSGGGGGRRWGGGRGSSSGAAARGPAVLDVAALSVAAPGVAAVQPAVAAPGVVVPGVAEALEGKKADDDSDITASWGANQSGEGELDLSEDGLAERVSGMSVKELKKTIVDAGLSHANCIRSKEETELKKRAVMALRGGPRLSAVRRFICPCMRGFIERKRVSREWSKIARPHFTGSSDEVAAPKVDEWMQERLRKQGIDVNVDMFKFTLCSGLKTSSGEMLATKPTNMRLYINNDDRILLTIATSPGVQRGSHTRSIVHVTTVAKNVILAPENPLDEDIVNGLERHELTFGELLRLKRDSFTIEDIRGKRAIASRAAAAVAIARLKHAIEPPPTTRTRGKTQLFVPGASSFTAKEKGKSEIIKKAPPPSTTGRAAGVGGRVKKLGRKSDSTDIKEEKKKTKKLKRQVVAAEKGRREAEEKARTMAKKLNKEKDKKKRSSPMGQPAAMQRQVSAKANQFASPTLSNSARAALISSVSSIASTAVAALGTTSNAAAAAGLAQVAMSATMAVTEAVGGGGGAGSASVAGGSGGGLEAWLEERDLSGLFNSLITERFNTVERVMDMDDGEKEKRTDFWAAAHLHIFQFYT